MDYVRELVIYAAYGCRDGYVSFTYFPDSKYPYFLTDFETQAKY